MTLIEKIRQIERLHLLIKRRATGSPTELAQKFNMSERCIYRLIDELKSMGLEISYNRIRESYEYLTPVEIRFSLEIKDDNQKSVIGGEKYFEFFSSLPDFGSELTYV